MDILISKKSSRHREPFIGRDRLNTLNEACGRLENVTDKKICFGSFPGHPVMPGVLIIERWLQAGAVCVLKTDAFRGRLRFLPEWTRCGSAPVIPGDTIRLDVLPNNSVEQSDFATGRAYVDDQLGCTAISSLR